MIKLLPFLYDILISGSEFARLYGGGDGAAGTPSSSSRHQHSNSSSSTGAQRPMSLPGPASSLGPGEPLDLPPALIPDRWQFIAKQHVNLSQFSPPEIPLNWKKSSFYTLIALDDEIGEFHIENTCNCTLRFTLGLATAGLKMTASKLQNLGSCLHLPFLDLSLVALKHLEPFVAFFVPRRLARKFCPAILPGLHHMYKWYDSHGIGAEFDLALGFTWPSRRGWKLGLTR